MHSQLLFYQDVFHGGVTGAGFSTGVNNSAFSDQIEVYIETGSLIKSAYLICNRFGIVTPVTINFNGNNYTYDASNQIGLDYNIYFSTGVHISAVHAIDVTQEITSGQNVYQLSCPSQSNNNNIGVMYGAFYLFIVYENATLPKTACSIFINETDASDFVNYQIDGLFPINTFDPIGLALHTDIIWDTIFDGSYVYVNNNYIGLIGGSDAVNSTWVGGGVKGHYYYQNNQLFGLDDDTPNNSMVATDGLANISDLLNMGNSSLEIDIVKQINAPYNIYISFHLAYTTPCDTFTATVTPDTITCAGQPLQLQATGGQAYAWQPQVGLSCYNCPNPLFQHDSTINYTVRIWNTDSCSKVLPMRVRVLPPVISTAAVTNSECEQPTGSIALLPASGGTPPYSYSINNIPNGSNPNFTGLAPGIYTVQINDSGGCTWNDTLTVGKNILAQAAFTATPAAGLTPLTVQFTNQSTGAANATWFTNGHTAQTWNYQHIYDQEGSYPVTLIVWNTDSLCSDTASFTVVAQTEMAIVVPTLWNIGMLPQYSLHTTNVKHLRFRLYDDTGRLIIDHELHEPVGLTEIPMSFANLTRPATAAYVYRIEATGLKGEERVFTGKVVVVR